MNNFAWSYSALKNFETCPKRYYHYDVAKDVKKPESDEQREGNALHRAFDQRIGKGVALPARYQMYEKMLAKFSGAPGVTFSEQKLALTGDFVPSPYFGASVWFRTVADYLNVREDRAVVADWKTGKVKEDDTQLMLMALTVFAYHPYVQSVKSALVFVAYEVTVPMEYHRENTMEYWNEILPRVKALETARSTQEFPPKPGFLCRKWCHVRSCPHHGK